MSTIPEKSLESIINRRVRTIGFPRSSQMMTAPAPVGGQLQPTVGPRPGPRPRPKGRLFVSMILITLFGGVALILWNEFARYAAYGAIEGRVVSVAVPWAGIVDEMLVEDGQLVSEGQLLARINNIDLKLRLAKLDEDISLARASLTTRQNELLSRGREVDLLFAQTQAQHDQLVGQMHVERARFEELKFELESLEQIDIAGAIANVELEQRRFACAGQRLRIKELEAAVERLHQSLDSARNASVDTDTTAEHSRLNGLQAEYKRLVEYQQLGEIRSPTNGRILRTEHWKGEFVDSNTQLFQVLKEDSLRAVLFVKQSQAARYEPKQALRIIVPPNRTASEYVVDRIDDETRSVPPNLARYFRSHERLVCVIARPSDHDARGTQTSKPIWLGAEVRMPHRLRDWLPTFSLATSQANP